MASTAPAPVPMTIDHAQVRELLMTRVKTGANWFYWIAALSLVNTIASLSGSQWHFILGLGVTQIIDYAAKELNQGGAVIVAVVFDLVPLALLCLFGFLARKEHLWAFWVGIVLYALDGVLFIVTVDILGLVFHGLALFYLYKGVAALRSLKRFEQSPAVLAASATPLR